ncbi:hypothetical protein [Spirillospora sp. NPDC048823]|uniref:hypothetical protein n=1 Tax=unclassified Spirillospora TaxID=2642701 RepID=UPI0037186832
MLGELIDRGLVAEDAPRPGAGLGRPARRYRFRAEAGHALGIDIDAHRVRLVVADLAGGVAGGHRAGLDVQAPPGERAGDLLVSELRRRVEPLCLSPVRIVASELGDESVGLGAVRLALDRIDEDLFRVDRPSHPSHPSDG